MDKRRRVTCEWCETETSRDNLKKHWQTKKCMQAQKDAVERGSASYKTLSDTDSIISEVESNAPSTESKSEKGVATEEKEDFGKENNTRIMNAVWTQKAEGWDLAMLDHKHPNIKYIICQLEMSEDGYAHFQGYIELDNAMTVTALKKKIFKSKNTYIKKRAAQSTSERAAHYCKKPVEACMCSWCIKHNKDDLGGPCICKDCIEARELVDNGLILVDGKPVRLEVGEHSGMSRAEMRTRIITAIRDEKRPYHEVALQYAEYAIEHSAGVKFLAACVEMGEPTLRIDLRVEWLFGMSGAGKSWAAYTRMNTVPGDKSVYKWTANCKKPLRYAQQKKVIIDEWNANKIDVDHLKELLDVMPTTTAIHNGDVAWNPHEIVLTSNGCPWEMIHDPLDRIAIHRRCQRVAHYSKPYGQMSSPEDGVTVFPFTGKDPLIAWKAFGGRSADGDV